MAARWIVAGVALTALGAAGCGGSRHGLAAVTTTAQKPASVAAVVRAFGREGVQLLPITNRSPRVAVVAVIDRGRSWPPGTVTHPATASSAPPAPTMPKHVAWFGATDPQFRATMLVFVFRSAEIARKANPILSENYLMHCSHGNNVVECYLLLRHSTQPWLAHARLALSHL